MLASKASKAKGVLPLIGIALFVYLLLDVGVLKIIDAFIGIDAIYLMLSLPLVGAYVILQTFKWHHIMKKGGMKVEFLTALRIYFMGVFWGIITPGRLGSLMRIKYMMDRTKNSLGECSSSVILDRVMDLLCLFVIGTVGAVIFTEKLPLGVLWEIAIIFAAFVLVSVMALNRGTSRRIMRIVYRVAVPKGLKGEARQNFGSFYDNIPPARDLILPFAANIAAWLSMFSLCYLVALSLGMTIPFLQLVTLYPLAVLIGFIPITIGGWGTREVVLIALFAPFGAVAEKVIVMSIVSFVIGSVLPALVGALLVVPRRDKAR